MTIPVFIAPVLTRYDLLARMLKSVDEPVGRGLIIDNGRQPDQTRWFEESLIGPEWEVTRPAFTSMGLPGSINYGIRQTYDAPWWLWASDDLVFGPSDLHTIAGMMNDAGDQPVIVTYRFAFMALNRAVVDRIGLLDEWSFWPIYFDDTDYARRAALANIPVLHDKWHITEGADGFAHSTTVQTNEVLSHANNRSWAHNRAAYAAKWGGLPGHETYDTPWDTGWPLWVTKPDMEGRTVRAWP
jgi:hypothetical protein